MNCVENVKFLVDGIVVIGRFKFLFKFVGVLFIVFFLIDCSRFDEYDIVDGLCCYGWIVFVYIMVFDV